METIYQSKYIVININQEKKFLDFTWLEGNDDYS